MMVNLILGDGAFACEHPHKFNKEEIKGIYFLVEGWGLKVRVCRFSVIVEMFLKFEIGLVLSPH